MSSAIRSVPRTGRGSELMAIDSTVSSSAHSEPSGVCDRCFQPIHDESVHGLNLCPFEPRPSSQRYFQDHVPGGFWIENMTPQPLHFESHSQHRAKMKELGLIPRVRHVEGDKHVSRWAGIDAQTLENARLLVGGSK